MNIREIAADIARELRVHSERWALHHAGAPWDSPGLPRCLVGLIRKRDPKIRMDMPEFVQAIGGSLATYASTVGDSVKVMLWNDRQESVDAIIKVCEKVAGNAALDPGFVKLRGELNELAAVCELQESIRAARIGCLWPHHPTPPDIRTRKVEVEPAISVQVGVGESHAP
jgi:hypothetical protein